MSKTLQQEKEQIIVVLEGGQISTIYSSIPEKTLEVTILNTDSRKGREETRQYLDEIIESGVAPYTLY